jgi:hypothetical protein
MNGNEELPENLGETRSPTVNPTSIFTASRLMTLSIVFDM